MATSVVSEDGTSHCTRIPWDEVAEDVKVKYTCNTAGTLASMPLDYGLLMCQDPTCTYKEHTNGIDNTYTSIITKALCDASKTTFMLVRKKIMFQCYPRMDRLC